MATVGANSITAQNITDINAAIVAIAAAVTAANAPEPVLRGSPRVRHGDELRGDSVPLPVYVDLSGTGGQFRGTTAPDFDLDQHERIPSIAAAIRPA